MAKFTKSLICLILCIVSVFSLVSCKLVDIAKELTDEVSRLIVDLNEEGYVPPDGYTAGVTSNRLQLKEFIQVWFETYDELMDALNRTREYGTEIPCKPFFNCDEPGMDVKFRVSFPRKNNGVVEEGKDYFDKYITNLSIYVYVFFEDITIQELEYSYYDLYDGFEIGHLNRYIKINAPENTDDVDIYFDAHDPRKCIVEYDGEQQFNFKTNTHTTVITEEQFEILKKTISIIE